MFGIAKPENLLFNLTKTVREQKNRRDYPEKRLENLKKKHMCTLRLPDIRTHFILTFDELFDYFQHKIHTTHLHPDPENKKKQKETKIAPKINYRNRKCGNSLVRIFIILLFLSLSIT